MNYPNLCDAIERSEITSRVACDIVNAALKDMGELNQRSAIDQSKLNGQRILWKTKVIEEEKRQKIEMLCIVLEGRNTVSYTHLTLPTTPYV